MDHSLTIEALYLIRTGLLTLEHEANDSSS